MDNEDFGRNNPPFQHYIPSCYGEYQRYIPSCYTRETAALPDEDAETEKETAVKPARKRLVAVK
jgi:hypothetical protein